MEEESVEPEAEDEVSMERGKSRIVNIIKCLKVDANKDDLISKRLETNNVSLREKSLTSCFLWKPSQERMSVSRLKRDISGGCPPNKEGMK